RSCFFLAAGRRTVDVREADGRGQWHEKAQRFAARSSGCDRQGTGRASAGRRSRLTRIWHGRFSTFGPFAELNSVVRAVTYHEGWLLEQGMVRLASENPSLLIMPSETALPIVPAALEMLERNDWRSLKGIRLRSEVHYKSSYVPDLFIVDPGQHRALIVDM